MNFALTPVVQRLLILNVALFAATFLLRGTLDLNAWLALNGWYSGKFIPTQFVTHMFMHGDFMHIFSNMIGLIVFGPLLERFLGTNRFLFLYLFTGIGAGLLFWGVDTYEIYQVREHAYDYFAHPTPENFADFINHYPTAKYNYPSLLNYIEAFAENPGLDRMIQESISAVSYNAAVYSASSMVGASGAVFGIIMAFAMLFPNTELMLLFPPFPIKAKYLALGYGLLELYTLIQSRPNDNVAHFAHLAGMGFAFILIRYWNKNRNYFY